MSSIFKNGFLLVFIFCCQFVLAQENPIANDTVKVYRDIERYSKKSRFTKFIHRLIFEPVAQQKVKKKYLSKKIKE